MKAWFLGVVREGKELILATKPFAQEKRSVSWWCVISTLVFLAAAMAGTLWNFHWIGKLICSVLSGLLMVRFFVIYHDHQHNAILAKSKVADVIMKAYGIFALTPSSIWKASHNYHHNHNSKLRSAHIGSYPIMTKERYLETPFAEKFQYLFMRHPITIICGYLFIFLFGMCIYPFINNPKKHYDSLIATVFHITLSVVLVYFWGGSALFFTLLFPQFIGCGIGSYLFYAQHNFPTVTFTDQSGWTYEGAALESSSFMKMSPIMHYFTANIGYHHIHHLNSKIPFYRLPEVMAHMPEMQSPKTTSLNPVEVFRCLKLKVWDVESGRMIGHRQIRQN